MSEPIGDAAAALVNGNPEAIDRLFDGTGTEPQRRADLLDLLTAAWSKGYEEGLRNGAKALAKAVAPVCGALGPSGACTLIAKHSGLHANRRLEWP